MRSVEDKTDTSVKEAREEEPIFNWEPISIADANANYGNTSSNRTNSTTGTPRLRTEKVIDSEKIRLE